MMLSFSHLLQTTLMPATMNFSGLSTFRHRLKAGSMFTLKGFDVVGSNQTVRLSDSLLTILFGFSTKFDALTVPVSPILVERFRFRDIDSLLGLANTNKHNFQVYPLTRFLPDFVGDISYDIYSLLILTQYKNNGICFCSREGDDDDGDDMLGTISVLTKDGVGVNDREESSSAGTNTSGLATKKPQVLATPKVLKKAGNT